jgi:hypothetical protein
LVEIDPEIQSGAPVLRGARMPVCVIVVGGKVDSPSIMKSRAILKSRGVHA